MPELAVGRQHPWPVVLFFFSSRRRHTRSLCDWSSECSSDLSRASTLQICTPQTTSVVCFRRFPACSRALENSAFIKNLFQRRSRARLRVSRTQRWIAFWISLQDRKSVVKVRRGGVV